MSVAVPAVLDEDVRIIGEVEGREVDAWEEMDAPDALAELATAALLVINLVDEDGAAARAGVDDVGACVATVFAANGPDARVPVTPPAAPINTAPVPTHAASTLVTVHETITLGLRIMTPHQ